MFYYGDLVYAEGEEETCDKEKISQLNDEIAHSEVLRSPSPKAVAALFVSSSFSTLTISEKEYLHSSVCSDSSGILSFSTLDNTLFFSLLLEEVNGKEDKTNLRLFVCYCFHLLHIKNVSNVRKGVNEVKNNIKPSVDKGLQDPTKIVDYDILLVDFLLCKKQSLLNLLNSPSLQVGFSFHPQANPTKRTSKDKIVRKDGKDSKKRKDNRVAQITSKKAEQPFK